MNKWSILWYPSRGDGRVVPQLMMGSEDDIDGEFPSLFNTEAEAILAAETSPASAQWPYVTVELL